MSETGKKGAGRKKPGAKASDATPVVVKTGELVPADDLFPPALVRHQVRAEVPEEALQRAIRSGLAEKIQVDPLLESVVYEYRKNRSLVRSSGVLGLVQRRLQNILFWNSLKEPDRAMHQMSMTEIIDLLGISGSGGKPRREVLDYLRQLKLIELTLHSSESEAAGNHTATGVLSDFHFSSADDTVIYGINKITAALLRDAVFAANVDIRLQSKLKGRYSLAMLEIALAYLADGRTPDWDLDIWRRDLNVLGDETHREYRYFNQRVIQPALREVREVAGLNIEMHTTTKGKRVVSFWLEITKNAVGQIEGGLNAAASPTFVRLCNMGVRPADAIEAVTRDERQAKEIADFTEAKFAAGEISKPGPYAMKLIRENVQVKSQLERDAESKKAQKQQVELSVGDLTADIAEAKLRIINRMVLKYVGGVESADIVNLARSVAVRGAVPKTARQQLSKLVDEALLPDGEYEESAIAEIVKHPLFRSEVISMVDPDMAQLNKELVTRFGRTAIFGKGKGSR